MYTFFVWFQEELYPIHVCYILNFWPQYQDGQFTYEVYMGQSKYVWTLVQDDRFVSLTHVYWRCQKNVEA